MVRVFFALLVSMCLAVPGLAQVSLPSTTATASPTETVLPDPLTPEAVDALVSRLSDTEVRALLLERLDLVAQANANAGASDEVLNIFSLGTVGVMRAVSEAVSRLPLALTSIGDAFQTFFERIGPGGFVFMVTVMTLAILGAIAIELLFRRFIRNWVESVDTSISEPTLQQTLGFLGKRLTADFVAVFIFFLAANAIGSTLGPLLGPVMLESRAQGDVIVTYIEPIWGFLIVLPRMAAAVGRFMLAPQRTEFRMVHTDDWTAKRLFWHQIGLALLVGLTFWLPRFLEQNGIAFGTTRLGFWLNLSIHIYVIYLFWRYRHGFSMMMHGGDPDVTPAEAWAARAYPWFVIIATLATLWLVEVLAGYGMFELLRGMPHLFMLVLISFAPALDMVVRGLVRHLMPPMIGDGPIAERAHHSARRSYIRIGRVLVFGLVVLAIARIWGIDLTNLAAAGVGVQLAGRMIETLIILAFGYLIYELVSLYINRKLAAEHTAAGHDLNDEELGGGEGGGAGGSRLSTVLPLILATARVAILMVFALLAFGALGIDTTPLLAGAGIVGLAVGFGAQKLVSDVVSGIFFLIDDAFRTGEYVEVDGTMGTVEKISIRSMQLRHHRGPVHTIPYGEIPKLTNYSRDWVIMKLKFTVPFDTDPNKVKKIFKKIGAEMLEDPLWKDDFLQPFKSQGVFEIDDVGMVMRGKFMAKPGKQFTLRKEIYNKVKKAFEENGIDFARREVRVAIPGLDGSKELDDTERAAISAAASQAAQEMAEELPAASKPGD